MESKEGKAIFVRMADGMRGPYGLDVLMTLADGGAISPETLAGDSATGPWIPLGQHELSAELFRAKRVYDMRAAEFQRVNTVGSQPLELRDMIRAANAGSPIREQAPIPSQVPNDVEVLVRETAAASAAHEPPLVFVRRENRRRRDFIVLIATGDGIGAALLIDFRHEPLPFVVVIGFMAIYTICLSWIMWGVMDRY